MSDPIVVSGTVGTTTLPITGNVLSNARVALGESWIQYLVRVQTQAGADGDPGGILNAAAMGMNFGGDPDATGANWPLVADYSFNAVKYAAALGLTNVNGAWDVVAQRIASGAAAAPVVTPDPVPGVIDGWAVVYARMALQNAGGPAQAPASGITPPVPVAVPGVVYLVPSWQPGSPPAYTGSITASDVVVVEIDVGSVDSQPNFLCKISGSEYQSPPRDRIAVFSATPGDFSDQSSQFAKVEGTTATVEFAVGKGPAQGYPAPAKSSKMYLNVKCSNPAITGPADMRFDLFVPGYMA